MILRGTRLSINQKLGDESEVDEELTEDQEEQAEEDAFMVESGELSDEERKAAEEEIDALELEDLEEEDAPADEAEEEPEDEPPDPMTMVKSLEEQNAQLADRVRYMEGKYGEFNSTLKEIKESAGKAASKKTETSPTDAEIEAAAGSTEKFDLLEAEFPEWAAASKEREDRLLAEMDKRMPNLDGYVTVEQATKMADSAATRAIGFYELKDAHGDWQGTLKTPEFNAWYANQPLSVTELGDSNDPLDAKKVLDLFAAAQKADVKDDEEEEEEELSVDQKAKMRLARSIAPTRSKKANLRKRELTEDEAFLMGAGEL